MKTISLRVPPAFSDGPLYGEDGELIPGSWPVAMPHESIKGWHKHGTQAQGLQLCDFMGDDDYPVDEIPGGWRATSSTSWNFTDKDVYNEDGDLIESKYKTEVPMNHGDYMKHYPDDTEFKQHHTYAGWRPLD